MHDEEYQAELDGLKEANKKAQEDRISNRQKKYRNDKEKRIKEQEDFERKVAPKIRKILEKQPLYLQKIEEDEEKAEEEKELR